MKSWLKGGIIGLVVGVVLAIPSIVCGLSCGRGEDCMGCLIFAPLLLPALPMIFIFGEIFSYFLGPAMSSSDVLGISYFIFISISYLILYFLIGVLISWIIKRRKSRRNKQPLTQL